MNKHDRKQLQEALDHINSANDIITMIKEQEEERGEKFQEGIDNLDYAISDLESVIEYVDNTINN